MIKITKEDYLDYHGIDLEIELPGLDNDSQKVERAINLWSNRVYKEVQKSSMRPIPTDEELNDNQINSIKTAILEYGAYYLKNGDLYYQSGFDETRGQVISPEALDALRFPSYILDGLQKCGLIVKNIGRTSYIGDFYG